MVGTTSAWAPYDSSRATVLPAWSLVRGTRIRQPYSGLVSYHDSSSRSATVGPTTASDGKCAGSAGEHVLGLLERRHPAGLLRRRTPLGEQDRRRRVAAGVQQTAQSRPERVRQTEDDDGHEGGDIGGPVVPALADRGGGGDADDVDRGRLLGGQGHSGVRRDGGRRAHSGHHLEPDPGLVQGQGLLGEPVEHGGVAVHQADEQAVVGQRLGRLDQDLGAGCAGQLLAVLTVTGVDDLDVLRRETLEHRGAVDLVDDDRVRCREQVAGLDGDQSGVAGASADERDPGAHVAVRGRCGRCARGVSARGVGARGVGARGVGAWVWVQRCACWWWGSRDLLRHVGRLEDVGVLPEERGCAVNGPGCETLGTLGTPSGGSAGGRRCALVRAPRSAAPSSSSSAARRSPADAASSSARVATFAGSSSARSPPTVALSERRNVLAPSVVPRNARRDNSIPPAEPTSSLGSTAPADLAQHPDRRGAAGLQRA